MKENIIIYTMPFGKINIYKLGNVKLDKVIESGKYTRKLGNLEYNVKLGYDIDFSEQTYRALQMKKGIYLGHNMGTSCNMKIINNDLYFKMEEGVDYSKVYWSFILKYILPMLLYS